MARQIFTQKDAIRHAAGRIAVAVPLTVVVSWIMASIQLGINPDATVRVGYVTVSVIVIGAIVAALLTGGLAYYTARIMQELTLTRAELRRISRTDPLTGLPNRVLLQERLEWGLVRVVYGEYVALLYIDIDGFKSVNDSLGHRIGDELLKSVVVRLCGCLDETDIIARLGGDEFVVVQTAVKRSEDVIALVTRIYQSIREPHECLGHLVNTDASIGIALASQDGIDVEQLMKNADLAMYSAKEAGRRTYRFFEPEMDVRMKARYSLEIDLRHGIIEGDFEVYYQPIIDLQSN